MTENKRFIAKPETVSYEDTKTSEIFRPKYEMGFYKLLNAMNDLADENEELKQEITEQVNRKDSCLKTAHLLHLKNERLKQENEQLKSQLELYKEYYPSGVWITDLNSFELQKEMRELNDRKRD